MVTGCRLPVWVSSVSLSDSMIIFTHIPKTAGTTIKLILRRNYGIRHIDSGKIKKTVYGANDLRFARKIFLNPKAITGHNLVNPSTNIGLAEATLITILRDPVTRCASHYQYDVQQRNIKETFDEWIADESHQNLSVKIIAGSNDVEKAKNLLKESYHWIGITEKFKESLKLLNIQTGAGLNLQYKKMIIASSDNIKKQLLNTPETLDLLKKHNELDQELYDFTVKEIFLPAIEKHKDEIDKIIIPNEITSKRKSFKHKGSVMYNKFIYRSLVKIGKGDK